MDMMAEAHDHLMEWPMFISLLDWIDKGALPQLSIQLMGGEPTLSPLLAAMLVELARRGRKVIIFSNATLPIDEKIIELSRNNGVEWVINANTPSMYTTPQRENFSRNLSLLGARATLNVNFYSASVSYDYVFPYFDDYDIQRLMKIGICLPTHSKTNAYVSSEVFGPMKDTLDVFFSKAQQKGISIATECGVPTCLFKDLVKKYPGLVRNEKVSHCGSRLDITPDGKLINCLPLSKVAKISYSQFSDYAAAAQWFHEFLSPYHVLSGYCEQCLDCPEITTGNCMVCLANTLGDYNKIPIPALPGRDNR
jgi:sulfatase maturation enzyme AslB (radical SAM superfamily)